jgi:hypothetical protein
MRHGVEMHYTPAGGRAQRAHATVASLKRGLVRSQSAHHGRRQIVLSVGASGVAARQQKEGWRVIDDDSPCMLDAGDPGPLVDRYLEAHEGRHLVDQPRRILLTTATVREPLSRSVVSPLHHGDDKA